MGHNVTNSERACSSCSQKWLIKYGLGIDGWGRSPALEKGSLWHDLLEYVALEKTKGIPPKQSADIFFNESKAKCDSFELDPDILSLVQSMWSAYVDHYGGTEEDPFRDWTISHVEREVETIASAPFRSRSINATVSGKIDKLANLQTDSTGDIWIIEHKSTSLEPNSWISKHEYSPQGLFYAWMVQKTMPHRVKGIIYDVARTKEKRSVEELLRKDGKVKAFSESRLPMTTSDVYVEACGRMMDRHGIDPPSREKVLAALRQRESDGFWFKRFKVRFRQEDIDRAGKEMAVLASRLLKWWNHSSRWRFKVKESSKDMHRFSTVVVNALKDIGYLYPRNHAECVGMYGKCGYMELCRTYSEEAASCFSLRPTRSHEGE